MVKPIDKTRHRIRRLEVEIDRIRRQTTLGEDGAAMKRFKLSKLETSLAQQKRKLAHQERQHA